MIILLGLIFWRTLRIGQKVNEVLNIFPMDADCDVISETYRFNLEQCALDDYNSL